MQRVIEKPTEEKMSTLWQKFTASLAGLFQAMIYFGQFIANLPKISDLQ